MESDAVEESKEIEPEEVLIFGIAGVKCDEHFLYKTGFNEERVFELPLVEIAKLEVQKSFAYGRYLGALVSFACMYISFTYVGNEWVKWGIIVTLGLVSLGLLTDPWDRYMSIDSKHGSFDLDVEDSANPKDLDAFVIAVQSRVKQRKLEME